MPKMRGDDGRGRRHGSQQVPALQVLDADSGKLEPGLGRAGNRRDCLAAGLIAARAAMPMSGENI